ncbi:AMP-binding protein [Haploplasma axanthum]|uniref:Tyrocidine synthase I n=1 Tax=Haploplasma axanthum TaxID=29552 RepID=A0A449BE50_HAPAX|nr:AMP-binding protein [Haploplasma axanthum]VEU80733.1 Tyrocidine synthase I [Haploplasma axanthum]
MINTRINNVLEYLEKSASKYPSKIAFSDDKNSISYEELVLKAKIVGSAIAEYGLKQKPIGVINEKSVETIIVFMGIIYSGNFYALINPEHPIDRKNKIIETLDNPFFVLSKKYEKQIDSGLNINKYLSIEELLEKTTINELELLNIRKNHIDIDPLYSMFTSGSTGEPKGIVVSHRSVIDFIEVFVSEFEFTKDDIIGNQAPFDFDVSVKDIYTTLKTGATMQIIPKQKFSFPTLLLDFLCEREVTTLIWAVSALCIIPVFNGFQYKIPSKINKILFSGELMPIKHLNEWKKHLPDALYVNLYGPTEITCNCTFYTLPQGIYEKESMPIGKPFLNERVFLLDDNNELIEDANKQGEICVSGTALSLGYYNNKTETEKAFVQNPLNKYYNELIYRTGDLGFYGNDKELYFSSRKDFQVKHMGHRIELTEIDSAFLKIDNITRVATIYDKENKSIISFYQGEYESAEIVKKLRELLPKYMIPTKLIKVLNIPLTDNGKVNRKKLMEEYYE